MRLEPTPAAVLLRTVRYGHRAILGLPPRERPGAGRGGRHTVVIRPIGGTRVRQCIAPRQPAAGTAKKIPHFREERGPCVSYAERERRRDAGGERPPASRRNASRRTAC